MNTASDAADQVAARLPFFFLTGLLVLSSLLVGYSMMQTPALSNEIAFVAIASATVLAGRLLTRRLILSGSSYVCSVFVAISMFLLVVDSVSYPWKLFAVWLFVGALALILSLANLIQVRAGQFYVETFVELLMVLPFLPRIGVLLKGAA